MKSPELLKVATDFEEKTSLVQRLRFIIISVIIFILLVFLGVYLTMQPFLHGLQKMNAANITMTEISATIDSLETADQVVGELPTTTNLKDSKFVFDEAQKLLKESGQRAISHAREFPSIRARLEQAQLSNKNYQEAVERSYGLRNKPASAEGLTSELIVCQQYSKELKEILRSAFLMTKDVSDKEFSGLYRNRFKPLLAGGLITFFFLVFVLFFGSSITKRLKNALTNLSIATQNVSQGNLDYRAQILNDDEIGHLTYAFNLMVDILSFQKGSLQTSATRISNLQQITALFSEAVTTDKIFSIIMDYGIRAVGAQAAIIATVSEDGQELLIQRMDGYNYKLENLPINSELPLSEVIRYGQPFFEGNNEALVSRFPGTKNLKLVHSAHAVLPLQVGSQSLGSLTFSYEHQKVFNQDEKDFLIALTRQSAQALHRAQLFEDAKKAVQTRDEFLSIASHELRTPLTPLKLHLQGLARHVTQNRQEIQKEKIISIVETCDRQVTRLSRLIDDLLDVSRISAGKLTLNKECFNLAAMIDEVVKHYEGQLRTLKSDIIVHADPTIDVVMDKVRIEQVLINFITNAGKYAPGKPVTIELKAVGHKAFLSVQDQGPGIDPKDQGRIFDRFERIKTGENIGGLGLGLYISKQIVEAHGGQVSVTSTLGSGTTFIVELPV